MGLDLRGDSGVEAAPEDLCLLMQGRDGEFLARSKIGTFNCKSSKGLECIWVGILDHHRKW